jgi:hypothetical protein
MGLIGMNYVLLTAKEIPTALFLANSTVKLAAWPGLLACLATVETQLIDCRFDGI